VRKITRSMQPNMLSVAIFFLAVCVPFSGCKAVRLAVPEPDLRHANTASQEGDIAFARKDFYTALIKYLESVRFNPNSEYVYNKLGIAYSQLTYLQQAAESFEHSIQLNPKYTFAYNNLGSVYFAQKNLKKAEKCFKKAINLKDDEASFYMNLGSLYLEKKKRNKAIAEWRKGLAIDPNVLSKNSSVSLIGGASPSKERHYFMARLLAAEGKTELAIESLKLAINEGFTDIESVRKEHDFDPIRKDERFIDFMEQTDLLIRLKAKVGLPGN